MYQKTINYYRRGYSLLNFDGFILLIYFLPIKTIKIIRYLDLKTMDSSLFMRLLLIPVSLLLIVLSIGLLFVTPWPTLIGLFILSLFFTTEKNLIRTI